MQPTKPPGNRVLTPYDTGKVKIGLMYSYRQPWSPGRDAYALQTALLPRSAVQLSLYERFVARIAAFFRSFV